MGRRRWQALVVLALVALLAACSSSGGGSGSSGGSSNSSSSGSASGGSYKIGVMTDETGLAAATYATSALGIKASFEAINKAGGINGHTVQYVVADTNSTPAGALSAAQELVQRDGVFAIIDLSSVFFGAAPWLLQQDVPVVGPGIDSTEWNEPSYTNLFNVMGNRDIYAEVPSWGQFVKDNGGTVCGSIGASNIPSVTAAADVFTASCELAGLKAAPVNTSVPYGGTNVAAIALEFKNAGVNAIEFPESTNTSYELLADLKQLGVNVKLTLLAIGYGSDTLDNKADLAAAQGLGYSVTEMPIEVNSPATAEERQVLSPVGITVPTYAEAEAYISTAALQAGLEKAGTGTVSRAQFMTAMRGITNFNANGLYTDIGVVNFSQYNVKSYCLWAVKLAGDTFVPYPNLPYCSTATKDAS
jgi:branched-chain amino acid transport system substrate-binding protein